MSEESPKYLGPPRQPKDQTALRKLLEDLLNRHSAENGSDTPDYILAHFMLDCLAAFDSATRERDRWKGTGKR